MNKIAFLPILIFIFACVSCAGRTPSPAIIANPADVNKSCKNINQELEEINRQISEKYSKIKHDENYNLAVGLVGAFVPFAGFFSDYKQADLVEKNVLKHRFNHLVEIERKNGCGFEHSLKPVLNHCEDFYTLGCFWQP